MRSIDALTSIRFFAALYVLFLHSGSHFLLERFPALGFLGPFFANGYLGVPFFFVLSGFILAYIYAGKFRNPRDYSRYAVARFARVYPVYLLALLALLPLVLAEFSWRSIPQFLLLQKWLPLDFDHVLQNVNEPAWSLSVELGFYILFPPMVAVLGRLPVSGVGWVALAACALMLSLRLPSFVDMSNAPLAFVGAIPFVLLRVPEFVFGVCLGLLFRQRPDMFRSQWLLPSVLAATLAVLMSSSSLWVAPVATICFGLLIIGVAANEDSRIARVLSNRWLMLAGAASYALYILQYPVRYWVGQLFTGSAEIFGRLLYVPLLMAISIVVFLYFEEPVRERLRQKAGLPESQGGEVAAAVPAHRRG